MANKMLIDTTHPEETRVVVVRGNRVEEFDFESASRKQLRGNIYLAKVTRVEPSLQAAFVDYGGNRHGFLAFSEIHPDYYQIPVADRQALIAEEERAHRDAEAELDRRSSRRSRHKALSAKGDARKTGELEPRADEADAPETSAQPEAMTGATEDAGSPGPERADDSLEEVQAVGEDASAAEHKEAEHEEAEHEDEVSGEESDEDSSDEEASEHAVSFEEDSDEASDDEAVEAASPSSRRDGDGAQARRENGDDDSGEEEVIESVGGADALEEVQERMPRLRRQYKIQEVIKRRQIMLVQVVKEERGTKGAALTTYLSLAGRYSVLMPNTARGGGISRKITQPADRKRLKEVAQELEVPEGMGVILRTAGASRTKTEIKRDFEYLLRLWESVRDLTLKSTAPALVYEEGSLIKRSIRDLYTKDIDEILVAGEEGYKEARDFMRMLMPSHAKNVKLYKDSQPIFSRFGVESQLDAMFTPVMQLRSGGYIVLNQAEALVAIDVNSGRATREHHIEDTALKTNLEAAEEIARQLRLRDLAGLIVIDFIDMDEKRNNRAVERRLKECLKHDRARIQVGRISHFGLLEMSRQRIRSSVLESSTEKCLHCGGTGHVRSVASVSLHLLRMLEEMLLKGATHNLVVRTRTEVALYVLNHKRAHLRDLEERFRITITVNADATIGGAQPFVIEKGEQVHTIEVARALAVQPTSVAPPEEEEAEEDHDLDHEEAADAEDGEESRGEEREDGGGRRRRRRRRRGRRGEGREPTEFTSETVAEHTVVHGEDYEAEPEADEGIEGGVQARELQVGEGERRRRRRGRRGGRRHREAREGGIESTLPEDARPDIEPEIADAVADFGGPPAAAPAEEPPATEPRTAEPAETQQEEPAETRQEEPAEARQEEPAEARQEEPAEPRREEPTEAPAAYEPPPPETPAPRRGSTVREPAPIFGVPPTPLPTPRAVEPAPQAPEPASRPAEPAAQAEPAQPRRTGWWRRRG